MSKNVVCTINDPSFTKEIDVNFDKCKNSLDLKKIISSKLHIKETQFEIDKSDDFNYVKYTCKVHISITKRYKNIKFHFLFGKIISIDNCYQMTFSQIIDAFRKEGLYYSRPCLRNNFHIKVSSEEIQRIKYPLFASLSSDAIIEMTGGFISLNYANKKFAFTENEHYHTACNIIKEAFPGCSWVTIKNKRKEKVENNQLKKFESYEINVEFNISLYFKKKYDSAFSMPVSCLATINDLQKSLATLHEKTFNRNFRPCDFTIFDMNEREIADTNKLLSKVQDLNKKFYVDVDFERLLSQKKFHHRHSKRSKIESPEFNKIHEKVPFKTKITVVNEEDSPFNRKYERQNKEHSKKYYNEDKSPFHTRKYHGDEKETNEDKSHFHSRKNHGDEKETSEDKSPFHSRKNHGGEKAIVEEKSPSHSRKYHGDEKAIVEDEKRSIEDKSPFHSSPKEKIKEKVDEKSDELGKSVLSVLFVFEKTNEKKFYPVRKVVPLDSTFGELMKMIAFERRIEGQIRIRYRNKKQEKVPVHPDCNLRQVVDEISDDDREQKYTYFYVEVLPSVQKSPNDDDLLRKPKSKSKSSSDDDSSDASPSLKLKHPKDENQDKRKIHPSKLLKTKKVCDDDEKHPSKYVKDKKAYKDDDDEKHPSKFVKDKKAYNDDGDGEVRRRAKFVKEKEVRKEGDEKDHRSKHAKRPAVINEKSKEQNWGRISYVRQYSPDASSKDVDESSMDDFPFAFVYGKSKKSLKLRINSFLKDNEGQIKEAFRIDPGEPIEFVILREDGEDEVIEDGNEKMVALKNETIKICQKEENKIGGNKNRYYFQTNLDSRPCKIELDSDATVKTLKKAIADRNHVENLSNIKILFAGKELLNDIILEKLDVGDSKLFVYIRSDEDILLLTAKALLVDIPSSEYYYEYYDE